MKTAEVRQPVHIGKVVRNARVFNLRRPQGGTRGRSRRPGGYTAPVTFRPWLAWR